MNANLLARRSELVKRMVKGVQVQVVAADLVKNNALFSNVSIEAIKKDWTRRKIWLHLVMRPPDDTVLDEALASIREVATFAWVEYAKATSGSVKVSALRAVLEANAKLVDVLQSVGAINKTPLAITTVGPSDEEVWNRLTDVEQRELIAAAKVIAEARRKEQH